MAKIKRFKSITPPALTKLGSTTYIVPGFIKVPDDTTLADVYKAWDKQKPKPAPGMYCSTEELDAYLKGTYTGKVLKSAGDIVEKVKSSNGKSNYIVKLQNGQWSCTCTGYSFRKRCRHIDEVKLKHNK